MFFRPQVSGRYTSSLGAPRRGPRFATVGRLEQLEGRALLAVGAISTVAGNGIAGSKGDGAPAIAAQISSPDSLVVDAAGNLYIADASSAVIREVVKSTGTITTVAGSGVSGYHGDGGLAIYANISTPAGLALDADGNLYFSDQSNNVVREVVKSTGTMITVAGNGHAGYSGDGGLATAAQLKNPAALAIDGAGNIYIADAYNSVVRMLSKATGTISTVAGTGTSGYSGDTGAATKAQLNTPFGLALDHSGHLYISDFGNQAVRLLNTNTGTISTYAGVQNHHGYNNDGIPAQNAWLFYPSALAVDASDNLYIADFGNSRIRKVEQATGLISTLAGTGTPGFSGDSGPATAAQINYAQGVALDTLGNLYIGDSTNHRVREVTYSTVVLPTTVATTLNLNTSNSAAVYGQTITYTASVSPSAASSQTPGGTLQFVVDGVNYGAPVALTQGHASLTVAGLGAGSHAVNASYSGDTNFQTSTASTFYQSLAKAPLVVKANTVNSRAGNPLPALTATYTGFLNGDTAASLTSRPTLTTSATAASLAGSYPILVAGGASKNYAISTQPGTLNLAAPIKPVSVKGIMAGPKLAGVTVVFNGPLSAATAQSLANYTVVSAGKDGKYGTKDDIKVALKSALFNGSTSTLTLKFKVAQATTSGVQLVGRGLADVLGGLIDGAHTGQPGSSLVASFKGKTVTF